MAQSLRMAVLPVLVAHASLSSAELNAFPSRPIRFVPFASAESVDVQARVNAPKFRESGSL